jgi:glycosyltransferase involved in cell wall biosynthesis
MISVIIPSYNSEKTIARCLLSLKTQTYEGEYEIIVVDSSRDRTPEIVRERFPEVDFYHLPQKTDPGTARNFGLDKSHGDIICFIDSDCEASPDWLDQLISIHESYPYEAVGGSVENGNEPDAEVAWAGYMAEFREFLPDYPAREVNHIPTCNISYKRSVFERIGRFNAAFYPQEDLEFNYRLRKAGGKIFFIPSAKIHHHHRTALKAFLQHQKRVGKVTAQVLQLLPLEGAFLVKNPLLATAAVPFLPFVKWWRTVKIFSRWRPELLKQHPVAVAILGLGLFPWARGFLQGAWTRVHGIETSVSHHSHVE